MRRITSKSFRADLSVSLSRCARREPEGSNPKGLALSRPANDKEGRIDSALPHPFGADLSVSLSLFARREPEGSNPERLALSRLANDKAVGS